jgi:serine/threonine protein kinase
VWETISDEAKDLILHLLCPEKERYTAEEALNHEWFASENLSKAILSQLTLGRMREFTHVHELKKSIVMFIAYKSNNRQEIEKYRKLFLKMD